MESRTRTRIRLSLAVATVALCTWVALDDSATIAAQSNFVGGEPSRPDSSDIRTLRLPLRVWVTVELAQPLELANPHGRRRPGSHTDSR